VTLTGTGSSGTITSWSWTQVAATRTEDVEVTLPDGTVGTEPSTVEVPVTDENRVTLSGADSAVATFQAPAGYEGPLAFQLVVSGPAGTSEPTVVSVNVTAPDPTVPVQPTADAGADRTARRGSVVALDGSKSALADEYAWTQVSGPSVTLGGAATAKPSFTFPVMPLPTGTTSAGNPGYTVTSTPVVLELTVTGQGGLTSTDEITVQPQPENLAIASAEYRRGVEWRVSGTSDLRAGQRVAVVLGSTLTGRVLGTATVDAVGAWTFRGAGAVTPGTNTTVSAVSAMGGSRLAFTFRNR
jgi:hypothetical protein